MRQAVRPQAPQRLGRVPGQQQLLHLVEDPRGRDVLDQRGELDDGRRRLGLDLDPELGGEPDGPQHPDRVLAVARGRRPDQLEPPLAHVRDPADVVPDLLGRGIEVERVDGEVAPGGVLGLRAVDVVGQQASVLVDRVVALRRPERRHLDGLAADVDVDQPEAAADDVGATEQRFHLLRGRVGRDVEVLRREREQQVADRPTDDEGAEPRGLQPLRHLQRAMRQLRPPHRMVGGAVDARHAHDLRRPGDEAGDQAADHRAGRAARGAGAECAVNGGVAGARLATDRLSRGVDGAGS